MSEAIQTPEQMLLRTGAVSAILGSIISVAAGMGFSNLTNEVATETILRTIASRPTWYWPTVHLCFIIGAFLWVWAFNALANSLTYGVSWTLGRLGAVTIIVALLSMSLTHLSAASVCRRWLLPGRMRKHQNKPTC